jgi:hypothetical protein
MAPHARQKEAVTSGSVTHARSPQIEHTLRSSSSNHSRRSLFDMGAAG